MSFVIRAALVIGVLSWLALQRQGDATPGLPPGPGAVTDAALAAWRALPDSAREAALRDGGAAVARRAGTLAAASRDTLAESDRTPPWRGTHGPSNR